MVSQEFWEACKNTGQMTRLSTRAGIQSLQYFPLQHPSARLLAVEVDECKAVENVTWALLPETYLTRGVGQEWPTYISMEYIFNPFLSTLAVFVRAVVFCFDDSNFLINWTYVRRRKVRRPTNTSDAGSPFARSGIRQNSIPRLAGGFDCTPWSS